MLVLSRKRGDSVAVGEPENAGRTVKVTVLEIRQSQVKLGFEAPSDFPVHRWEVWERIQSELEADDGAPDSAERDKFAER